MKKILNKDVQRIFQFNPNYTESAARQQAEKLKLDTFGKLIKLKFWGDKLKEEDVAWNRTELKYEPFWFCEAQRDCQFIKSETHTITPKSVWATSLLINNLSHDVSDSLNTLKKSEVNIIENCHQVEVFKGYFSGSNSKEENLEKYVDTFKSSLLELGDNFGDSAYYVEPERKKSFVEQSAINKLSIPIDADEILDDICEFKSFYLYYRPVYQFEFKWTTGNKIGLVEIDGLTGDSFVRTDSQINLAMKKLLTRENLFEMSSEFAGSLIPGGGMVVMAVDILTKK